MTASRGESFHGLSRRYAAVGALALAMASPGTACAGATSGPSMMTNASNASLPAAQHNLGLPTIVKVVGDGVTDDWAKIQAAIDGATAPATIAIPAKPAGIRISQALRMRDNITLWSLDWNQPWLCTGDAGGVVGQWPFYSCVMFGSGESNNLALLTPIAVNDPAAGAVTLTLSAGNYTTLAPVVGDIIVVGATATFNNGAHDTPNASQMVRVTAVDGTAHTVTIHAPIEVATVGTQIWKLTHTGLNAQNASAQDTGVPMWASYQASVLGGAWTTSVANAPFSSAGGALEATVKVKTITAGYGLGYLNLWAGSRGEVENEYIKNVPVEMSWAAHGNSFKIGRIEMTGSGLPNWIFGAHEAARGNQVEVGTLNTAATTPVDVVHISRSTANQFHIGSIVGGGISHNTINIQSNDYTGTPPNTADNIVQIGSDNLSTHNVYAAIAGIYQGSTATVGGTLTGYTNGDVVTQGTTGGSCSIAPTWTLTVSGGNVTAATIANAGRCGVRPNLAQSTSGGTGTGLTLTVTYAGSATVNNTVRWGVYHGAITNGGGSGWNLLGVGAGNWIEGWGDNGSILQDAESSTASGFRNHRNSTGYYLANGSGVLVSGLTLSGTTTLPGSGQISSGGNLGIGGTPQVPLHVFGANGGAYAASQLAAGPRAYFQNTNATDNDYYRLVFMLTNSAASDVVGAGLTAIFTSHAAGAETGALAFQQRIAGTVQESGRFTSGGLFALGGGETASFPALKRSSTTLQARLADDSGFGFVQGKLKTDANYTAGATTATGYVTLYDATGTAYKVNACLASGC